MKKTIITTLVILIVLGGIGMTAHLVDFADLVKKLHGG